MPAGCNCGPSSPLAWALGCHCLRRGTAVIASQLPLPRTCKAPLFWIISGAILSELALRFSNHSESPDHFTLRLGLGLRLGGEQVIYHVPLRMFVLLVAKLLNVTVLCDYGYTTVSLITLRAKLRRSVL